jgi:hypothetical protein
MVETFAPEVRWDICTVRVASLRELVVSRASTLNQTPPVVRWGACRFHQAEAYHRTEDRTRGSRRQRGRGDRLRSSWTREHHIPIGGGDDDSSMLDFWTSFVGDMCKPEDPA